MLKVFMFFALLLARNACAQSDIDSNDCSVKCNIDNFDQNGGFWDDNCSSQVTENCENTCVKENNNYYYKCHQYLPVLCERHCSVTDKFLMNYNFCRAYCQTFKSDLCEKLCNTEDLFNENYDFCFNACDEFPEAICNEKCSNAVNFTLNGDLCYGGCSHLGRNICTKDCDNLEDFLKHEFCRDCNSNKLHICSNTCFYDRSKYDEHIEFCNENCPSDVPKEVCNEKCNTTESILKAKDFCEKGCDSNASKLCDNKCATEELKVENAEFCQFCKKRPVKYPASIPPGIMIRPKTCISLLCG